MFLIICNVCTSMTSKLQDTKKVDISRGRPSLEVAFFHMHKIFSKLPSFSSCQWKLVWRIIEAALRTHKISRCAENLRYRTARTRHSKSIRKGSRVYPNFTYLPAYSFCSLVYNTTSRYLAFASMRGIKEVHIPY